MIRKSYLKWTPLLAATFTLASCGGDSGSPTPTPTLSPSPTSSPSPTPTPTPSPTPTPAPPPLTTLPVPVTVASGTSAPILTAPPASGTVFPVDCVGPDAVTTDSFATVESFQTPRPSDVLHYSQTENRYTFIDQNTSTIGVFGEQLDLSVSFGPGDVLASQSNQQKTVFQRACNGFATGRKVVYASTLTLFNPGPANPALVLNYASYGNLLFSMVTKDGQRLLVRPFGYGFATNAAGLNRTGVVTYSGLVEGKSSTDAMLFGGQADVTGTLVLTVDFTQKTFTAVVDLTLTNGGTPLHIGSFTFQQSGGADLSMLVGTASGGSLSGFLAGPAAEEVAIALYLGPQLGDKTLRLSGAAKR